MAASAHMRRALELAQQARHRTSPNPMVGAVVVVDGEIVGEGYHRRAGEDHAEIVALRQAGEAARAESHRLRSVYDGVLVGAATVIDDDPQLTARGFDGSSAERQPARVVLDGRLRVPATARVFARDGGGTTMVATSRGGYAR